MVPSSPSSRSVPNLMTVERQLADAFTPPSRLTRWFAGWGRAYHVTLDHAGALGVLTWQILVSIVRFRVRYRDVLTQTYVMGIQSLPIVFVTASLAGIVTSQQGGYQIVSTSPRYLLGTLVVQSVVLELGPLLTAIVLVGRIGARITAELGTMAVSEQIDAFKSLGRDPVAMLGAPRVIAGIITMPLLVGFADVIGIAAAMVAANLDGGLGFETFLYGARLFWHNWDLFYGFSKAVVFGFVIPLISVHMGLRTSGGAEGVGLTTTNAVMFMILTLLIMDAMFPPLMLQ
ncbi:MAG: ABC transporter permease [Gemmatimonadetes bacterium]|nr:ABC transporter permease [Gemmatimonadota bacterium]